MKSLSEIVSEYRLHNDKYLTNEEARQIYEMATIGWFSELKPNGKPVGGEFKVFINGSEGRIPHVHIWDDDTNGKQFHTCVYLTEPKYFNHGHKNSKFTKKQLKYFLEFLQEPDDENEDLTRWKVLLQDWNRGNRFNKVDLTLPIPDYSKLITLKTTKIQIFSYFLYS